MENNENEPLGCGEYPVGYGRPPMHSRFRPGRSGNPKGRPKGSKNFRTLLNEELARTVVLIENGQPKKITRRSAIAKKLVNAALGGDLKAINTVLLQDQQALEEKALKDGASQAAASESDARLIESLKRRLAEIGD